MNEDILDLRFAICDSGRVAHQLSLTPNSFSLTTRFTGVWDPRGSQNRFSGFNKHSQTAEAVQVLARIITPLKRGANEKLLLDSAFGI
jgi:hypothetical protein